MIAITYLSGSDLKIINEFDVIDWCFLFGIGISLVIAQKFAFKAISNLPVPTIVPLQFTGLLF